MGVNGIVVIGLGGNSLIKSEDRQSISHQYEADEETVRTIVDPGSMGPKVEAILKFLRNGGKRGIITDPANVSRALFGDEGTHFVAA